MVTAMLLRIHQSGHLARLDASAAAQVKEGIRVYKEIMREHIPDAVPFYPLGMPDVTNAINPIALGIRSTKRSFLAVWDRRICRSSFTRHEACRDSLSEGSRNHDPSIRLRVRRSFPKAKNGMRSLSIKPDVLRIQHRAK